MLTLPRLNETIFPDVPSASPTFDCDDGTLYMYRHFQDLGMEVTPILGNIEMSGEGLRECDHVWLLVKAGDRNIAYDWGLPYFDKQHYEGYTIGLDYLLEAVAADFEDGDAVIPGNP